MKFTAVDKINLFISTYIQMFGNILRFSAWSGFWGLALLQLAGLILLVEIRLPGWNSIMHPILALFLPAPGFHFPKYLLAVPGLYATLDNYLLGPTAWVILSAAAVFNLSSLYSNKRPYLSRGLSRAIRSYLPLLFVWFLELILVFAVFKIASFLLLDSVYGSPRAYLAVRIGLQLAAFLPSAFLIYAIPGIIIDKLSIFKALGQSVNLCSQNLFMTYSIIFFPGLIRLGFDILIQDYSFKIVSTFNPDIIPVIMALKILVGIFINLFILGTATYIYRVLNHD